MYTTQRPQVDRIKLNQEQFPTRRIRWRWSENTKSNWNEKKNILPK